MQARKRNVPFRTLIPLEQPQSVNELLHDLRQPVAAIAALVAAAETVPDIPAKVLERLAQIQEESRQISDMIRQVQTGSLAPEPLDAGTLALAVAGTIRTATGGEVRIVADAGATVVADEAAVRRVLSNLLDNAIRAAGPEGTVLVRVQRSGRWIQFDVHDSGPGFGFGPQGTSGLGLHIVEQLTEAHGGEVMFLRSHLGGTLARLHLPAPMPKELSGTTAATSRP